MTTLQKYLRTTFGQAITVYPLPNPETLPPGITIEYQVFSCTIYDTRVLLMKPRRKNLTVNAVCEHFALLSAQEDSQPVLWLERATAKQRATLVEHSVPFVVPGYALFLPFIYINWDEGPKTPPRIPNETFTPATQLVYLYLLYQDLDYFTPMKLSKILGISRMTISRAFYDFDKFGLVHSKGEAPHKQVIRKRRAEFWERGKKHLASPVKEICLFKQTPAKPRFEAFVSGNHYALGPGARKLINDDDTYDDLFLAGEDYVEVELWAYEPKLLARDEQADAVSVLLATKNPEKAAELKAAISELVSKP